MKALITGGAGFIGSNLCSALLNNKNLVVCIDNETTGSSDTINDLNQNENFTYINQDILNLSEDFFDKFNFDVVFNLACPTPPAFVRDHPNLVKTASIEGAKRLIELIEKKNIKLIHVSTVRVNEDPPGINVYTDSKRYSEELVLGYNNSVIVRLASVYGPNMLKNDSRVIPQFIQKALSNQNLTMWGDGSQLDSFAYIDDVVNFLLFSVSLPYEIYTIGSSVPISIKQLAEKIITVSESKSHIEFINPEFKSARTLNYLNDISFYFKETADLDKGLSKTIDFFSELLVD